MNISFHISPTEIKKFERRLKQVSEQKAMDLLRGENFKDRLKNTVIKIVVEHMDKEQGPEGKWPGISQSTIRTRRVKKGLASRGYGWRNVLPPSARAFFSSGLRADMINRTKITLFENRKTGLSYRVGFDSNRISQDVSYGRSGYRRKEIDQAHTPIMMGGPIVPVHAKALVIPITQAKARMVAEGYLGVYKAKHPRTRKEGISPGGARGRNLSYRDAGIIKVGGQTALLRPINFVRPRMVGGNRKFVYLKPSEVNKIIRGVRGFAGRQR